MAKPAQVHSNGAIHDGKISFGQQNVNGHRWE